MVRVNDLIPSVSGFANLGVDVGPNATNAFDISTLRPFGHVVQLSGVYCDPLLGQSGIIRYTRAIPAFQVSLDGGLTFNDIVTGATVVTSVGVIGDTNLTGAVDFASPASGFIVIEDTANASPLLWSVNTLALSGLWGFPANGFAHVPQCHAQSFVAATSWTITHNLNTTDVSVMLFDGGSPRNWILADKIETTNANTVTALFNSPQEGRAIVIACP